MSLNLGALVQAELGEPGLPHDAKVRQTLLQIQAHLVTEAATFSTNNILLVACHAVDGELKKPVTNFWLYEARFMCVGECRHQASSGATVAKGGLCISRSA